MTSLVMARLSSAGRGLILLKDDGTSTPVRDNDPDLSHFPSTVKASNALPGMPFCT